MDVNEETGLMRLSLSDCGPDSVTAYAPILRSETGDALTQADLEGRLLLVRGIVDQYDGQYFIRVYTQDGITILE
jgi:hypothetical protein